MRHLEQLLKSQPDSNQVKRIAESFFNRELDHIKWEICYIKQAIDTNQEEIERVDVQVHKKLGNLVHILQIKLIFRHRENALRIVSRTGECFPWNPLEGRGLRHLYIFIMYRMAQILLFYENLGMARVPSKPPRYVP